MSHRGSIALTCLFLALAFQTDVPAAETGRSANVWVMNGMARLDPLGAKPGATAIQIAAARSEYEAIQVAVQAVDEPVTVGDVALTDLVGQAGHKIPATNATRYREHCVYVRRPSYQSDARVGLYPDALVPFVSPIDGAPLTEWNERRNPKGAKYDAIPRKIAPGFTETFWIDLCVPGATAPGDYKGHVRVTLAGRKPILIPVDLHVWSFALPDIPTVRSHFGAFQRVAAAHGVKPDSPEYVVIEKRYCAAMAEHRITPDVPRHLLPKRNPDGSIDPSQTHEKLADFMKRHRVNAIQVMHLSRVPAGKDRETTRRYLAEMQAYLAKHGWIDGAYIYVLDEPNDKQAYETVRQLGAFIHEAAPKIKVLCTEQTKPSKPDWGNLNGAVDVWVPLWPLHDEPTAQERLAAGNELWSYTALCQGGKDPLFWQLDFPLLDYRVWAWLNYRYQMTGLLYWASVYWGHVKDPWLDQPSFRLAYNGEGMLFYPGRDAGFDGPVVSMRLKQIRDGMEDYEYLHILAQRAGRDKAMAFARRIGRTWRDWEKDPEKLLAVRAELARAIEAAK
ncbi:MAG: DUF4091 domain-containing protein [Phycisphaerae bacterium]|nr:DUF4091 domain-containing protein [Phycisphaerae bacterium]